MLSQSKVQRIRKLHRYGQTTSGSGMVDEIVTDSKINFSAKDAEALPALKNLSVPTDVLPCGCYVVTWAESAACRLIGSLRVSRVDGDCFASGDIYQCQSGGGVPDEFPAFPPDKCRFYFAVQSVEVGCRADGVRCLSLVIDRSSFQFPEQRDKTQTVWSKSGVMSGVMTMLLLADTASSGHGAVHYNGYVVAGIVASGNELPVQDAYPAVSIAWHDGWLRKAMVDVLVEHDGDDGISDALGGVITSIATQIRWKIVPGIRSRVARQPNKAWTRTELHAAMAELRHAAGDGPAFRYAAILVDQIYGRYYGLMFDHDAVDGDLLPREAFAVSYGRKLSGALAIDAEVRNQPLSSVSVAFQHVVAHEFGHVLNSDHDRIGTRFMRTTDEIIGDPTNKKSPFPGNVESSYVRSDVLFFQHAPDWVVRPGGERFVHDSSADEVSNENSASQRFDVPGNVRFAAEPVRDCFPLGAPVRLELCLVVTSDDHTISLPKRLGLSVGNIRGWVTDPKGIRRSFKPLLRCSIGGSETDEQSQANWGCAESSGSLTLLRGGEGELFPSPGRYTIKLVAFWQWRGTRYRVETQTHVCVAEAKSEMHKQAARILLKTPEVFLALAVGTLKSRSGVDALKQALQCEVLREHYAWIVAKRAYHLARKSKLGSRRRKALLMRYRELVKAGHLVLTRDEAEKLKGFEPIAE